MVFKKINLINNFTQNNKNFSKMMLNILIFIFIIIFESSVVNSELLIKSSKKILNSTIIAEYNGNYISTIDADIIQTLRIKRDSRDNDEFIIEENSNISLFETQPLSKNLWNLDSLDNISDYNYDYNHTGKDVLVYVIDSGISIQKDFEDRVMPGISFDPPGKNTEDCLGHGTHVSSIIGSKTYGVAKKVKIVPVKVFDCERITFVSLIIQGIYWVIKQPKGIVNLSIGGTFNIILNNAIKELVDAGFIVVVAAGNDGVDACLRSPSSEKSAIVAGCTTKNEEICTYSNIGSCVTIFAPGDNILGLIPGNNVENNIGYKSGTSMSSPHVAGVAAIILEMIPNISQIELKEILNTLAKNNTLYSFKQLRSFTIKQQIFVPKCGLLNKKICESLNCKFYNNIGCRTRNFCGFKNKKVCKMYKRCKYTSGKCKIK